MKTNKTNKKIIQGSLLAVALVGTAAFAINTKIANNPPMTQEEFEAIFVEDEMVNGIGGTKERSALTVDTNAELSPREMDANWDPASLKITETTSTTMTVEFTLASGVTLAGGSYITYGYSNSGDFAEDGTFTKDEITQSDLTTVSGDTYSYTITGLKPNKATRVSRMGINGTTYNVDVTTTTPALITPGTFDIPSDGVTGRGIDVTFQLGAGETLSTDAGESYVAFVDTAHVFNHDGVLADDIATVNAITDLSSLTTEETTALNNLKAGKVEEYENSVYADLTNTDHVELVSYDDTTNSYRYTIEAGTITYGSEEDPTTVNTEIIPRTEYQLKQVKMNGSYYYSYDFDEILTTPANTKVTTPADYEPKNVTIVAGSEEFDGFDVSFDLYDATTATELDPATSKFIVQEDIDGTPSGTDIELSFNDATAVEGGLVGGTTESFLYTLKGLEGNTRYHLTEIVINGESFVMETDLSAATLSVVEAGTLGLIVPSTYDPYSLDVTFKLLPGAVFETENSNVTLATGTVDGAETVYEFADLGTNNSTETDTYQYTIAGLDSYTEYFVTGLTINDEIIEVTPSSAITLQDQEPKNVAVSNPQLESFDIAFDLINDVTVGSTDTITYTDGTTPVTENISDLTVATKSTGTTTNYSYTIDGLLSNTTYTVTNMNIGGQSFDVLDNTGAALTITTLEDKEPESVTLLNPTSTSMDVSFSFNPTTEFDKTKSSITLNGGTAIAFNDASVVPVTEDDTTNTYQYTITGLTQDTEYNVTEMVINEETFTPTVTAVSTLPYLDSASVALTNATTTTLDLGFTINPGLTDAEVDKDLSSVTYTDGTTPTTKKLSELTGGETTAGSNTYLYTLADLTSGTKYSVTDVTINGVPFTFAPDAVAETTLFDDEAKSPAFVKGVETTDSVVVEFGKYPTTTIDPDKTTISIQESGTTTPITKTITELGGLTADLETADDNLYQFRIDGLNPNTSYDLIDISINEQPTTVTGQNITTLPEYIDGSLSIIPASETKEGFGITFNTNANIAGTTIVDPETSSVVLTNNVTSTDVPAIKLDSTIGGETTPGSNVYEYQFVGLDAGTQYTVKTLTINDVPYTPTGVQTITLLDNDAKDPKVISSGVDYIVLEFGLYSTTTIEAATNAEVVLNDGTTDKTFDLKTLTDLETTNPDLYQYKLDGLESETTYTVKSLNINGEDAISGVTEPITGDTLPFYVDDTFKVISGSETTTSFDFEFTVNEGTTIEAANSSVTVTNKTNAGVQEGEVKFDTANITGGETSTPLKYQYTVDGLYAGAEYTVDKLKINGKEKDFTGLTDLTNFTVQLDYDLTPTDIKISNIGSVYTMGLEFRLHENTEVKLDSTTSIKISDVYTGSESGETYWNLVETINGSDWTDVSDGTDPNLRKYEVIGDHTVSHNSSHSDWMYWSEITINGGTAVINENGDDVILPGTEGTIQLEEPLDLTKPMEISEVTAYSFRLTFYTNEEIDDSNYVNLSLNDEGTSKLIDSHLEHEAGTLTYSVVIDDDVWGSGKITPNTDYYVSKIQIGDANYDSEDYPDVMPPKITTLEDTTATDVSITDSTTGSIFVEFSTHSNTTLDLASSSVTIKEAGGTEEVVSLAGNTDLDSDDTDSKHKFEIKHNDGSDLSSNVSYEVTAVTINNGTPTPVTGVTMNTKIDNTPTAVNITNATTTTLDLEFQVSDASVIDADKSFITAGIDSDEDGTIDDVVDPVALSALTDNNTDPNAYSFTISGLNPDTQYVVANIGIDSEGIYTDYPIGISGKTIALIDGAITITEHDTQKSNGFYLDINLGDGVTLDEVSSSLSVVNKDDSEDTYDKSYVESVTQIDATENIWRVSIVGLQWNKTYKIDSLFINGIDISSSVADLEYKTKFGIQKITTTTNPLSSSVIEYQFTTNGVVEMVKGTDWIEVKRNGVDVIEREPYSTHDDVPPTEYGDTITVELSSADIDASSGESKPFQPGEVITLDSITLANYGTATGAQLVDGGIITAADAAITIPSEKDVKSIGIIEDSVTATSFDFEITLTKGVTFDPENAYIILATNSGTEEIKFSDLTLVSETTGTSRTETTTYRYRVDGLDAHETYWVEGVSMNGYNYEVETEHIEVGKDVPEEINSDSNNTWLILFAAIGAIFIIPAIVLVVIRYKRD